jgi:signal peptidase I
MGKGVLDMTKFKTNGKEIIETLIVAFFVCAAVLFVFDNHVVMSGSMEPTLMTGDTVLDLNKLFYGKVGHGSIVTFKMSVNGKMETVSKRIIGMPGDKISFKDNDGYVYINDEKISEPYVLKQGDTYKGLASEYTVPDGCVFLMGDNREDSFDSRYWDNPFIKIKDIKGVYLKTVKSATGARQRH